MSISLIRKELILGMWLTNQDFWVKVYSDSQNNVPF